MSAFDPKAPQVRMLVCGGRAYANWSRICDALDRYHAKVGLACIIHGAGGRVQPMPNGARAVQGADLLAEEWAKARGVPFEAYPAAWRAFGRAAGPLRNARMLRDAHPHYVVAFPGGAGTADMVKRAEAAGIPVARLFPDPPGGAVADWVVFGQAVQS